MEESKLYKLFWVKGIPFKISFFMWKLWKAKVPLDDWFLRLGYFTTSRCRCCGNPEEETLPRVFLTSPAARFMWNYFGAPTWIKTEGKQLVQVIDEWWSKPPNTSLKAVRRPYFKGINPNWPDLHEKLLHHIPILRYTKVLWKLPLDGWIKCNTDGASRGDNGGVSYGFCIRDGIGDLIYAQADAVHDATNNIGEAHAIFEALRYFGWSLVLYCDQTY
ncbi:uncharacterized protein LOC142169583 [Nicotiana tabacum]|uniref:Uncharacterized protein LOC142169583 n=1 Tax=Nicotiana tabacum TaxID=4097 RepID=A0AC58SRI3_TOBAC